MRAERVYAYSDPLNDDFAGTNITTCRVGKEFRFVRSSLLWRAVSFVVYYVIAFPIVWLVARLYLGLRFENKKVLRQLRGKGFFLYGNHTQILDAFLPAIAAFPRRAYIVAGPDVVSIPGIKHLVMLLGALPIPTEMSAMRGFLDAISLRYRQNACVAMFPEAHIWPYYTGIRPFPDTSFRYPVKENAPAVAMVVTYRKRKGLFRVAMVVTYRKRKGLFRFLKRPAITVSFSEIMMPDRSLTPRKAQRALRNRALAFMEAVAGSKDQICYIRYEYKPKTDTGVPREAEGKEHAE